VKRNRKAVLGRIRLSDGTLVVVRDRHIHALLLGQQEVIARLQEEVRRLTDQQPGRIVLPTRAH